MATGTGTGGCLSPSDIAHRTQEIFDLLVLRNPSTSTRTRVKSSDTYSQPSGPNVHSFAALAEVWVQTDPERAELVRDV